MINQSKICVERLSVVDESCVEPTFFHQSLAFSEIILIFAADLVLMQYELYGKDNN